MVKGTIIAGIIIVIALGILFSGEFTGRTVEGECSGTNSYYLCLDGEGDFVLSGSAVPTSEINEAAGDYTSCKLVSLESNVDFVFRYTNSAVKGVVYNSAEELLGENLNEYATANYKCHLEGDCTLECSEYRVW